MTEKKGTNTPAISLPKGGGAIKGIGETFQPNLFSGTGNFSIPIYTSPCRGDFGPKLTLQYSTGNGNGPFGLGWQLSIPRITRKTEKGLPKYRDADVFVMSGAEDLVPSCPQIAENHQPADYQITRYRPRTEGLFARIEKWVKKSDAGDIHWRATTKENITSIYGKSVNARIVDPAKSSRIYEWLLEETFDAKGNHILYEYAGENENRVQNKIYEQNRSYVSQRYIRRIFYGNIPEGVEVGPERTGTHHQDNYSTIKDPVNRFYVFEIVFDYSKLEDGDNPDYTNPPASRELENIDDNWLVREDPFSSFRSGFEIRTLRRCERVLMFHHFKESGNTPTLVKSTDFKYDNDPQTNLSILSSATVTGYKKKNNGSYLSSDMPPVTFKYSEFKPHEQKYKPVTARGNDMPSMSLKNPETTLVDLFGDGLPDVLNTTSTGYYFWQNLGNANLDVRQQQHAVPAGISLSQPGVAFGDVGGDGMADLIVQWPEMAGFYEATSDGEWKPFKKFPTCPSFSLGDPNVRLIDLTGDGRSDVLMTRDLHFLWFECKGEEGYGDPKAVIRLHDLKAFPDVYFNDPSGRVRLADMTGDGLNDIVRLHNGRVVYWPNLGYGKFGKRITMTGSPRLECNFDPSRLFMADLDGSGCADMAYVDMGKVHFWFNQSGNGWSDEHVIKGTPPVTDIDSVQFADIFGTGTATLVWSYDYNYQLGGNYKALDFCGGKKPYVLNEMSNNMGATTKAQYVSSTKFYLEDKKAGNPWATNLPFPVQVLEKTEVIDHISKTKLVTTYKYHHGYYDGKEREFRGFGRVDQYDTEIFDDFSKNNLHEGNVEVRNKQKEFHVPPVLTKNWFHTGVYFDEDMPDANGSFFDHHRLMDVYKKEFYDGDAKAFKMGDQLFEPAQGSSQTDTPHEIFRALRGSMLRTEVYAQDGSGKADHPYSVTQNRYKIKELQEKGINNHAVYLTTQKESISYHYERNPNDPRIGHQINLAYDDFGNLVESVAVSYPRRNPLLDESGDAYPEQADIKAIYSFNRYINEVSQPGLYYVGLPCESKTFEVHGLSFQWPGSGGTVTPLTASAFDLIRGKNNYEDYSTPKRDIVGFKKRLIEWTRQYYRQDQTPGHIDPVGNLAHRLDFGIVESLALPYQTYQAAFTENFISSLLSVNINDNDFQTEGGYHKETQAEPGPEADNNLLAVWWIPSGRQAFNSEIFFISEEGQDPFGNTSSTDFDDYGLLMETATDAADNIITAVNDYRVLQPYQVTDPNNNISQAAFDTLGMVVGTAIMGVDKDGNTVGDSLNGFETDLHQQVIDGHLSDPLNNPHALLNMATTCLIYDLQRYIRTGEPNVVCSMSRETHVSEENSTPIQIQHSFIYSDGFGREVQTKVQVEPDPALPNNPRWVGTGTTIYNNKGKAVEQYEPFFSNDHLYNIEKHGVSPILFYDPLERVVCTVHPNHTYEKVVFDAWQQESWDANDTIHPGFRFDPRSPNNLPDHIYSPADDPDVGFYFRRLPDERFLPTWYDLRLDPTKAIVKWPDVDENGDSIVENAAIRAAERRAAEKAAKHAATPALSHLDNLGRSFLSIADNGKDRNGTDVYFTTRVELDIEGNDIRITDPRKITAFEHVFDLGGRKLKVDSKDAGVRFNLPDISGENPWYVWDANGNEIKMEYDALRRPIKVWVKKDGAPRLVNHTQYGDEAGITETQRHNLRGQVYRVLDDAGEVINSNYDFKGNLLTVQRKLLQNYKLEVDWNSAASPALETDANGDSVFYGATNVYDALNRITESTAPDGSIHKLTFNEANLLETVKVRLNGEPGDRDFVTNIEYDAKGQREKIYYGNGVVTVYTYDPETYRLLTIVTKKSSAKTIQDLRYTFDPVGNITQIHDAAYETVFNHNQRVDPINRYKYDAIYRLIEAAGREHESMTACHYQAQDKKHTEFIPIIPNQPINNGQAIHNYTQYFTYDESGNITQIKHVGHNGWTRNQEYFDTNNQLKTSKAGCNNEATFEFPHDNNGNIEEMPHLRKMKWDYANRLTEVETNIQTNGSCDRAFYNYDAGGQRVKKVIEIGNKKAEERIYIGGYEIYRKYNGGADTTFERSTLHVMDDTKRIALIETKTKDTNSIDSGPTLRIRYQFDNHLGSSLLEIDENKKEISYEEYYPYGGTAYMAGESWAEVKLKRYRYSGKERDDETGLYYYGARYYAAWLGRWLSCDPMLQKQPNEARNLFWYANASPIVLLDKDGRDVTVLESNITAQKLVSMIKRQEQIPKGIRDAITVNPKKSNKITFAPPNEVGVSKEAKNFKKWVNLYQELEVAARSDEWALTTGTVRFMEDVNQIEPDLPSGSVVMGTKDSLVYLKSNLLDIQESKQGEAVYGRTLPSQTMAADLSNEGRWNVAEKMLRDTVADKRGVVIIANRIEGSTVGMSFDSTKIPESKIVETFFHELALHAGGISQRNPDVGFVHGSTRVEQLDKDLKIMMQSPKSQAEKR